VLHIGLTVPEAFPTDLIAAAEIVIGPAGATDLQLPPISSGFFEVNGLAVNIRTEIRDGRLVLVVSYSENPFRGRQADLYLYPKLAPGFDGGKIPDTPVTIKATVFSADGTPFATGQATTDLSGQPIRFGDTDRSVQISMTCVPNSVCDHPTAAIPGSQGVARVTVVRSRGCPPTASLEGDLYVLLFPASAAGFQNNSISAVQPGTDFGPENTSVTLDLPPVPPGPYWAFAIQDVGGDLPEGSFVAGPGDMISALRPVDVFAGRISPIQVTLDEIVDVGRCNGGLPTAPVAPILTGSIPPSPSNENNPQILGNAEPGAAISLFSDPNCTVRTLGDGQADNHGSFSVLATVDDDTTTTFYAVATNAMGYASPCSSTRVVYVEDSTPPLPPTGLATTPSSPSKSNALVLTGMAEPFAGIVVYRDVPCSGAPAATGTVAMDGTFSLNLSVADNVTTTFFAQAVDAAGNASDCSTGVPYANDKQPPAPPTLTTTSPGSPSKNTTPLIFGTAEAGSTVHLYVDPACTTEIGSGGAAEVLGGGGLQVTVGANSTTTFYATAVDAAGNASACSASSLTYVCDNTPPIAPTLTSVSPTSPSPMSNVTLQGGAEPGTILRIYTDPQCALAVVGTGNVAASGSFSININVASNQTTTFYATAQDRAANVSACSTGLSYTQDNLPPTFTGAAAATPLSTTDVSISWPTAADVNGIAGYQICVNSVRGSCSNFVVAQTAASSPATVSGLAEDTRYFFVVRAKDAAGNVDANTKEVSARTFSTRATRAIAAGGTYTCALEADGTARCFGRNDGAQLGDGTTNTTSTPVAVSGLTGANAISVRTSHSCAVLSDGTAKCWGDNSFGQLGTGTTTASPTPVPVTGLGTGRVVRIATGDTHTCALFADGVPRCWGKNDKGQLGTPLVNQSSTPFPVAISNVTALSAGANHNCVIVETSNRQGLPISLCWGSNSDGQVGDGTTTDQFSPVPTLFSPTPIALAAGGAHTCIINSNRNLTCWGRGAEGQLGNNSTSQANTPVSLSTFFPVTPIAVAAGEKHTCFLFVDGTADCWGSNSSGQIGDRSATNRLVPTAVANLTDAIGITAGGEHTCALRSDGTARCWGSDYSGQLGDGRNVNESKPVPLVGLSGGVGGVRVSVGASHVCALRADGTARCWGFNFFGQLGDGTTDDKAVPSEVNGLTQANWISAGGSHSCAILSDGTVHCWGLNATGQLGDNTTTNRPAPVIASVNYNNYTQVSAGGAHTCARTANGSIYCWGKNDQGQLGVGGTANASTPSSIGGFGIVSVSAGGSHSCSFDFNGKAQCWGSNSDGQIGQDPTVNPQYLTPTPVIGSDLFATDMALGDAHSCVASADGRVKCWGRNLNGQLGTGNTSSTFTPTAVTTIANALSVAAGSQHSCALIRDGSVHCWGSNAQGQLGDGTGADSLTPVTVQGLIDAIAIGAGGTTSCALEATGAMQCWGQNSRGQLGNGLFGNGSKSPTPVVEFP
jgi:alpha-tubulin suppressor-like RCC1 family protein